MPKNQAQYVIISSVRNEGDHIEKTIYSVINQNVRPTKWIIVNDGSNDDTGDILDRYTKKYSWIRVIHRRDRGFRKSGWGVIEAFYDGYVILKSKYWQFLVKLDGDLSFDGDYFEKCFDHFVKNPRLGIGGGTLCSIVNGRIEVERKKDPKFHVRGATKIYRRQCWEAMGGLLKAAGWDTLDEVKANMLGWTTMTFPEIQAIHHRLTGNADGAWHNFVKNGTGSYIAGYHPLYIAMKCMKESFKKPYLMGAIALAYGFISAYVRKMPQIQDKELIAYMRQQQLGRILLKKTIWQ